MRRIVLLLVVLAMSAVWFSPGATAQDETSPVLPLAPDPANWCKVAPRPLAEVKAIWEEINATPTTATPSGGEITYPSPEGTPADEQTVKEITAALVEVIACAANGNDGLRDAANVTERHLRDSNNLLGLSQEDFEAFYTENPVPSDPEHRIMVYALRDVRILPDGRVGVQPDIIVPGVGHFRDDYVIFQKAGDRWLIDFSYSGPNSYPVQ